MTDQVTFFCWCSATHHRETALFCSVLDCPSLSTSPLAVLCGTASCSALFWSANQSPQDYCALQLFYESKVPTGNFLFACWINPVTTSFSRSDFFRSMYRFETSVLKIVALGFYVLVCSVLSSLLYRSLFCFTDNHGTRLTNPTDTADSSFPSLQKQPSLARHDETAVFLGCSESFRSLAYRMSCTAIAPNMSKPWYTQWKHTFLYLQRMFALLGLTLLLNLLSRVVIFLWLKLLPPCSNFASRQTMTSFSEPTRILASFFQLFQPNMNFLVLDCSVQLFEARLEWQTCEKWSGNTYLYMSVREA